FGEGNRGNIHNLIEQIRHRRFLMIGDGRNRKSIACLDNLVDFLLAQLPREPGVRCFNYADKPDYAIGELVALIRVLLDGEAGGGPPLSRFAVPYPLGLLAGYGFDLAAWSIRRPFAVSSDRIRKFCSDTTIAIPAVERTGFRARVSIEEGL